MTLPDWEALPSPFPQRFSPVFLTKRGCIRKLSWKETWGREVAIIRRAQEREGFKAWQRFLIWLKAKLVIYIFSF